MRHACAGDAGDAAHGAGQPPVVELQGPGQVGASPAVGAVPFGGQGGQFPDGMDVAGPAAPAARSRRTAGRARYRPTAAGRPAGWRRCRGPGRSSTGRRVREGAAVSSASVTVWVSSSNRSARFRPASSPAWSSRALMAQTWPRRAATWTARAARLSSSARGEDSAGRSRVMMSCRPVRRTGSCGRFRLAARPAGPVRRRPGWLCCGPRSPGECGTRRAGRPSWSGAVRLSQPSGASGSAGSGVASSTIRRRPRAVSGAARANRSTVQQLPGQ